MGTSPWLPNRVPQREHSDPDPVSDPSSGWLERFGDGSTSPDQRAAEERQEREAKAGGPEMHDDPVWAREDIALGLAIPRGPAEQVRMRKTRLIYDTESGSSSSLIRRLGHGSVHPESPDCVWYREIWRDEQQSETGTPALEGKDGEHGDGTPEDGDHQREPESFARSEQEAPSSFPTFSQRAIEGPMDPDSRATFALREARQDELRKRMAEESASGELGKQRGRGGGGLLDGCFSDERDEGHRKWCADESGPSDENRKEFEYEPFERGWYRGA